MREEEMEFAATKMVMLDRSRKCGKRCHLRRIAWPHFHRIGWVELTQATNEPEVAVTGKKANFAEDSRNRVYRRFGFRLTPLRCARRGAGRASRSGSGSRPGPSGRAACLPTGDVAWH